MNDNLKEQLDLLQSEYESHIEQMKIREIGDDYYYTNGSRDADEKHRIKLLNEINSIAKQLLEIKED